MLILASGIPGCVSISAFASLVCRPVCITRSAVAIKICAITKKKERHDKVVLLGTDKLNDIKVVISKALIDSYIIHNEFAFMNNALRQYNEIKNFV